MFRPLSLITALALSTAALPVLAQQAETDDPAAEATTGDTPAPAAQSPLDLGQEVATGPQLGERYSKEKFGDWDLACIKTEGETDPCSLLQILTDGNDNPVAEVSLFRIDNGGQAAAGATVLVPLETLLTAQLTISVDDGPGKRYNFAFCNQLGCAAQIGLTQQDIDAFKRGKTATVSIVPAPAPDQVVALPMSLSGFTAGYEAVDVLRQ
ncbi:invasion associated locus B family protein [Sedimentitalea arenosa]|jgi:invasion protein IalB|uniref:Invasion associated locus B family protein n=1 Tax=Sedimentitalea arenosa TaxID=2798803 RepID=A0A8J7IQE2_9RHOB|nr:invasion associated locus B family protein [Arenibacterium arenosum]MBJ6371731.1 invasion associated locus B family protein [Arenibacterium arenosum]